MPLARWVEQNLVDPLTGGRHMLLRETIRLLAAHVPKTTTGPLSTPQPHPEGINDQISLSLYKYPSAMAQLMSLRQIMTHQLDMSALIHQPGELFESEEVWAGREWKRRKTAEMAGENQESEAVKEEQGTNAGMGWLGDGTKYEGPEMLQHVMDHTAVVITALDRRLQANRSASLGDGKVTGGLPSSRPLKRKREDGEEEVKDEPKEDEDSMLRNLRLNLLALAKRAPLDKIARLPADMVPEHIRPFVPTLG